MVYFYYLKLSFYFEVFKIFVLQLNDLINELLNFINYVLKFLIWIFCNNFKLSTSVISKSQTTHKNGKTHLQV